MAGYGYMYAAATQPNAYSDKYDPDHICRPVYIDAEGKKRPIIAYTTTPVAPQSNTDHYVSKAKSVIREYVKTPMASLGIHAADLLKNCQHSEQKSSSPFNPAKETTREFFKRMQNENNYNNLSNKEPQRIDVSSTAESGMITTGGWVRPSRETWATRPNTSLYEPKSDITSYSQGQRSSNSYREFYRAEDYTISGRARLSGPDYLLSTPASDVNRSVEYRKEPAIIKPSVPDTSIYTNPVDNSTTATRYGNFSLLLRKTENEYLPTPTIDSIEASRKYRATTV